MKKPIILFILFCMLSSLTLFGQNNSLWVVYSENKCHSKHISDLNQYTKDTWAPILNEIVESGTWSNWGVMNHAWGNEWNWNIYYIAPDRESFFKGFSEMIKKMNEKHPDWFQKSQEWCFEHKDNMYVQSIGYGMDQGN